MQMYILSCKSLKSWPLQNHNKPQLYTKLNKANGFLSLPICTIIIKQYRANEKSKY